MILSMDCSAAASYKSGSQIARLVTEAWGGSNLYCAACDSPCLATAPPNTKAIDYRCPACNAGYQLKSGRAWNEHRIPDAGYEAMIASIRSDRTPNLLVLQYTNDWRIRNLMLVPSFFFSEAAIERRPPLAATARRAGWVGCNILLSAIATEGKVRIVDDGFVRSPTAVRTQYDRIRPLAQVASESRGWLLDVLAAVTRIGKHRFSLADVYRYDAELAASHPDNQNVRPKIRQKLQVLRNMGLIDFLGNGEYALQDAAAHQAP